MTLHYLPLSVFILVPVTFIITWVFRLSPRPRRALIPFITAFSVSFSLLAPQDRLQPLHYFWLGFDVFRQQNIRLLGCAFSQFQFEQPSIFRPPTYLNLNVVRITKSAQNNGCRLILKLMCRTLFCIYYEFQIYSGCVAETCGTRLSIHQVYWYS